MRRLTQSQRARAADCLSIAYSHLRSSQALISSGEYASGLAELYFSFLLGAQAALADLGQPSKKHKYWITKFNKRFGRGRSWVPKSYVTRLNRLSEIRPRVDYEGSVPNDEYQAGVYLRQAGLFLKKVRKNTPVLNYPEFISGVLARHNEMRAVEFDYYCPKSYSHKERVQIQVRADTYSARLPNVVARGGAAAIRLLGAKRREDYVLGWNNRFGQGSNQYLLFLDLDELDLGKVKAALRERAGWIFKSGEGYHFVGSVLMPSRKLWLHRLRQAASSRALRNLIDQRHVEHSILRGYSTLRIKSSEVKPFVPFMCLDAVR